VGLAALCLGGWSPAMAPAVNAVLFAALDARVGVLHGIWATQDQPDYQARRWVRGSSNNNRAYSSESDMQECSAHDALSNSSRGRSSCQCHW
jgi:hypothetical protein